MILFQDFQASNAGHLGKCSLGPGEKCKGNSHVLCCVLRRLRRFVLESPHTIDILEDIGGALWAQLR